MASKLKIFTVKQLGQKDDYSDPKNPTIIPAETEEDLMLKIQAVIDDAGIAPGALTNWSIVKLERIIKGSGDASYWVVVEGD
jgi:hypothetical protein